MYSRIQAAWHKRFCKKDRYARHLHEYQKGGDILQRMGLRFTCLYCGNVFLSKKAYSKHISSRSCSYNKHETFKNKEKRSAVLYDKVFTKYDQSKELIELLCRRFESYNDLLMIVGEFATIAEWANFRKLDIFSESHGLMVSSFLHELNLVKYDAVPISENQINFGANQYYEPHSWTTRDWNRFYSVLYESVHRDNFVNYSLNSVKPEYGSIYNIVYSNLKPEALGLEPLDDSAVLKDTDEFTFNRQQEKLKKSNENSILPTTELEKELLPLWEGKDDTSIFQVEERITKIVTKFKPSEDEIKKGKSWNEPAWFFYCKYNQHKFTCDQKIFARIMKCSPTKASEMKKRYKKIHPNSPLQ